MTLMKTARAALLGAYSASLAGCATLSSKTNGAWGREYSGVRCVGTEDYWAGLSEAMRGTQALYTATDYLFSAVLDTAFLPIDLITHGVEKLTAAPNAPVSPLCNDNTRHG